MTAILNPPHRLFRRHQSFVEGAIAAAGLAAIVGLVLLAMPVYPPNWAPVIVAAIALTGLRWPMLAYLFAVVAVLYPIYVISLYLAVLFLALTVLGHRVLAHYLGATVLVLAVPLLTEYHLHWTVPLLAGLWWGTSAGAWMGGLAALWGKLLAGMAGLNPDWITLPGQPATLAGIVQRFHSLSSLETLLKLLQPFAPDTSTLLYHLLQIVIWAAAGAVVGTLAGRTWIRHRQPWSTVPVAVVGVLIMLGGHWALISWLTDVGPDQPDLTVQVGVATIAMLIAAPLAMVRHSLELPVAPRPRIGKPILSWRARLGQVRRPPQRDSAPVEPRPVPVPELPEWEAPDEDNGLIMLELD
jgi:hypothetical protein